MGRFEVLYANEVLTIERDGRIDQGYLVEGVNSAYPHQYGRAGERHAWALDRRGRMHLIDVEAARVSIVAGEAKAEYVTRSYALPSKSGESLFLIGPGDGGKAEARLVLQTIDVASGMLRHVHTIAGKWSHHRDAAPVVAADGKLLVPILRKANAGEIETGIVCIDPRTGERDETLIPEEGYGVGLIAISPDGRHCLRPDLTLLPSDAGGTLKNWLTGKKSPRRFGFTMQLWQTRPLAFVRRLTIGWFHENELPNEIYYGPKGPSKLPLAARGECFGIIADVTKRLALGPQSRPRQSDFPEPYASSATDWGLLISHWKKFATEWAQNFVWAEDSKGFWHTANGLVAMTTVDGLSTPRLLLARIGYSADTWLPTTAFPLKIEALPGWRARLTHCDGRAIVSGPLAAIPNEPVAIAVDSDGWEPNDANAMRRLYEHAENVKRRARVVEIPLASLREVDCIAAIEALQAALGPQFLDRAVENQINVDFVMPGRVLDEAEFFPYVEESCPNAATALRGLIAALCAIPGLRNRELFSNGAKGIGLLSGAARAFARLDPSPIDLVRAYGRLMDVEHEYSYINSVVPALIRNLGWTADVLDFAVWLIQANFYNSMDHKRLWEEWGMGQAAQRYQPDEFGQMLTRKLEAHATEPMEDGKHYRYFILDLLAREIEPKDEWTRQMFASLKVGANGGRS